MSFLAKAAACKIAAASNFQSIVDDYREILEDEQSLEEVLPANVYDRIKEALILEYLWHKSDELQRKKILYGYKKLYMTEILAFMYVLLFDFAYMEKGKFGSIVKELEKATDFLSEMRALSLSLNAVHYHGKMIPDYVGFLSDSELDELSDIPEKEILKYAKDKKISPLMQISSRFSSMYSPSK